LFRDCSFPSRAMRKAQIVSMYGYRWSCVLFALSGFAYRARAAGVATCRSFITLSNGTGDEMPNP
jgi:hypothetical protein